MDIEKVPLRKGADREDDDADSEGDEEIIGNLKLDMTEDKGKLKGDVPLIPTEDDSEVSISMESSEKEEEVDEDRMMLDELGEKPKKRIITEEDAVVETESVTSKTSSKKHLALTADEDLNDEELREKKKQDILWWFSRVNRSKHKLPKGITIPEVSDLDELETLEKQKNLIVKHINADRSISTWRKILVVVFYGIEFGGTEYLNVDLTGYADEQIATMDQYDELLVELGDGGMLQWLEGWPAWAKLLLMISWNTVLFIVTRFFAKKINISEKGLKSMTRALFGKGSQKEDTSKPEEEEETETPRMKGPSIRISKSRKD